MDGGEQGTVGNEIGDSVNQEELSPAPLTANGLPSHDTLLQEDGLGRYA